MWLDQKYMAVLFATERSVITKHINNIFLSGELQRESNVQKMHIPGSDKPAAFYSLDAIISVGYRVNSRRGTEFRIWATRVLKDHILKGYTLNERRLQAQVGRLKELQNAVELMGRIISERSITGIEAEGLLKVITDYSLALSLLDQYDHQQLRLHGTTETSRFILTCETARAAVSRMAKSMGSPASNLVGREKDKGMESAIGAIYQTFGGRDLYPSIEEKAAHLLYFVVKNHSFVDGNKRIGAFHRTGAVEVWGRGTNRVIAMCRKHGAAPPVFEERQGFVVVTFKAPMVAGIGRKNAGEKSSEKILRLLEEEPELSAQELGRKLGLTSRAVEKNLSRLKKSGLIRRIGPDKGGRWVVLPAGAKETPSK